MPKSVCQADRYEYFRASPENGGAQIRWIWKRPAAMSCRTGTRPVGEEHAPLVPGIISAIRSSPDQSGETPNAHQHTMQGSINKVLVALSGAGLLLQQGKDVVNVVTLMTGETLRTSWWSHPKAGLIFAVLSELSEHPDVLFSKLLDGKVTLVHRKLWPAFLAIAMEEGPWQSRGLSAPARRLLASVNESKSPISSSGAAVKELEIRLLVHAHEIHSDSGRHELIVQPWSVWARHAAVKPLPSAAAARQQIEEAAKAIGAHPSALPWLSKLSKQRRHLTPLSDREHG
jgi:hypothetical protein